MKYAYAKLFITVAFDVWGKMYYTVNRFELAAIPINFNGIFHMKTTFHLLFATLLCYLVLFLFLIHFHIRQEHEVTLPA